MARKSYENLGLQMGFFERFWSFSFERKEKMREWIEVFRPLIY